MDIHKIQLPREIVIGDKVIESLGAVCRRLRLDGPCLLVTGENTFSIGGKQAMRSLESEGYVVNIEKAHSIDKSVVDAIVKKASTFKFIVAVGGGRIIDTGKYSSFKSGIPFVSVPTAPSHDGIASSRATIYSENGVKHSYEAQVPLAIVADLDIISKAPYRLISAGCADTISNMIAVEDWKLAATEKGEFFSDYAASISVVAANMVANSSEMIRKLDKQGIKNLVEALVSSGEAMCIAGSSRPASGSEHLFSHALDKVCPEKECLHGEQCGVGSILMAYLHKLPWEKIQDSLKSLGCATTAKELGVTEGAVIKALASAKDINPNRYTILHKESLDEKRAEELAKATGVI